MVFRTRSTTTEATSVTEDVTETERALLAAYVAGAVDKSTETGTERSEPVAAIQELADSLVWETYEGRRMRDREVDWSTGFAAGWNEALRRAAQLIDPAASIDTKPFAQRIRVAECPPGHADRGWQADPGKQIGVLTCECGWTKKSKRHNAREHHESHRSDMAASAAQGRKP